MKFPDSLNTGDTIAIVSPAKYIEKEFLANAVEFWRSQGFKVLVGKNAAKQNNYFAGTVEERLSDFQAMLNNAEVKAIICARGGYGCLDLVDSVNWAGMLTHPIWIIGFSDVTVFHQHLNRLEVASIHASMPLNYKSNSKESFGSLITALKGEKNAFSWSSSSFKSGSFKGRLLGGNLSIIHNLIGTDSQPDYENAILFIEEVGEFIYAIDRMFYALAKSGILDKIKGLVVGGLTSINDSEIPYGNTIEEVVLKHFQFRNIPIAFNFPAGHIDDNRALVFGNEYDFRVENGNCFLKG